MAANETYIPPKAAKPEPLRVAAYCRVSSDSSDQLRSYATQIKAYTEQIGAHADWELVDVYADEGLTGTRMDKREDFQRLLADCRKGKVDRVLCKSISRFARNTRDCLVALRELSALGVTVYQNQRMSYRRRMEKGEFITCYAPYGYDLKGQELVINEEQAAVVRYIFQQYLNGCSVERLAHDLTQMNVPTGFGQSKWWDYPIRYILKNEKYVGDTLCQKFYTTEHLPFINKMNHGEREQYYIENTHPPIVSREVFQKAQALLEKKSAKNVTHIAHILSLKICCGRCGTSYIRRVSLNGFATWVCRKHDRKAVDCSNGRIPETEIYAAFVRMYNKLKENADIILAPALKQLDDLETAMQRENPAMLEINRAIAQVAEQSHNISKLQTAGLLDADACAAKLSSIQTKLTQLRRERRRLLEHDDIEDAISRLHRTADTIKSGPEQLDTFDESLFEELVERIIAESQTCIRFRLWGGVELAEKVRRAKR